MKYFSNYINNVTLQSNDISGVNNIETNLGVTNHYTPVENILTNIRNLFCHILGIVATIGEDGLSIKLTSSDFISKEKVNELLWRSLYNDVFTYGSSSLQGYITSQGLRKVTTINLGGCFIVYFSPEDIYTAKDPVNMEDNAKSYTTEEPECCKKYYPCPLEMKESLLDEFEINSIYESDDLLGSDKDNSSDNTKDDKDNSNDELTNVPKTDNSNKDDKDDKANIIIDILKNPDKVKAAKQLEVLISQKIQLSRDYYFSAIKFISDDEAIALRWKRTKKLPTGKTTEVTNSLIHIFDSSENNVWVQYFAKDSIVELPREVKTLIENILKILGAEKEKDDGVYTIKGLGGESDHSEEDNQNDQNDEENQNNDDTSDDQTKDDKNNDSLL